MNRKGFAMATVLFMSIVFLVLIASLFFRSQSGRALQPKIEDQTKAMSLARGVMQLAMYKLKLLPAEFYRANKVKKLLGTSTEGANSEADKFFQKWLDDFDTTKTWAPLSKILQNLPDKDKNQYQAGISSFSIQKSKDSGYKKDLVRITVWASCNDEKRTYESVVEIEIPQGS